MLKSGLQDALAFVSVVEHGSFRAAAQALGLPRSSVSRRVAELERKLATKLLQRTTRKLRLTREGEGYYEHCERAFAELRKAERCLEHQQDQPTGVLKVTAPVGLGPAVLAELVAQYSRRYPQVQLFLELGDRYVDLVGEGFDVAVRAGPLEDSSLVARRVLIDALELVASPEYLDRAGTPGTLPDLKAHSCLLSRSEGGRAVWSLTGPDGVDSVEVTGPVRASDLGFVQLLAERGLGVALLPRLAVGKSLAVGKLVRVLPRYSSAQSPISIVTPSAAYLPAKTKAFVEMAVDALRDLAKTHAQGKD
jgi:DNA-binding transcriptional LysR family regulator